MQALVRVQLVARAGGLGPLINLCGSPPVPAAKPAEPGAKKKKAAKVNVPRSLAHLHENLTCKVTGSCARTHLIIGLSQYHRGVLGVRGLRAAWTVQLGCVCCLLMARRQHPSIIDSIV